MVKKKMAAVAHIDKPPATQLGGWVASRRVALNLSISQLATLVANDTERDCNQGRVCDWQAGRLIPRADQLKALKKILGGDPPAPVRARVAKVR